MIQIAESLGPSIADFPVDKLRVVAVPLGFTGQDEVHTLQVLLVVGRRGRDGLWYDEKGVSHHELSIKLIVGLIEGELGEHGPHEGHSSLGCLPESGVQVVH